MLTLTSNEQAKELIKNGFLAVEDDIEIAFDGFSIDADLICNNIYSKGSRRDISCWNISCKNISCKNISCVDITCKNISCGNITCWDISCVDITCKNISCKDISCVDITCRDISCWDISCGNITCRDISCWDISCKNISYYAHCIAYNNIKCKSIKGRRENSFHKCLDGKLTIIEENKEIDELKKQLAELQKKIDSLPTSI